MASLSSPGDDRGREERWSHDRRTGRLIAARSGASIALGDQVTVRILRADPAARELDLVVVRFVERAAAVAEEPAAGQGRKNRDFTGRGTRGTEGGWTKGRNRKGGKGKGRGRRGRRG